MAVVIIMAPITASSADLLLKVCGFFVRVRAAFNRKNRRPEKQVCATHSLVAGATRLCVVVYNNWD